MKEFIIFLIILSFGNYIGRILNKVEKSADKNLNGEETYAHFENNELSADELIDRIH